MLAPRRIGKTVLLNHLSETASEQGYRAIVLDVEGFHDEKDFFRQCCAAIQEELSSGTNVMTSFTHRLNKFLGRAAEGSDWRQMLLHTDWQEFADQLFNHLNDNKDQPPWLILVDELPIFIQSLSERKESTAIKSSLYWLRSMRQKYTNIRWLYAGSIGLDTVARRHNVEGALNGLHPYTLEPFDEKNARNFLTDIADRRNCKFESEASDAIISRLGWLSPYYLERVAEDACLEASDNCPIAPQTVDAAMDRLLDLPKRLYWASWREHLDRNFTEPHRSHLYTVLKTVAQGESGADRNLILTKLNRGGEPVDEVEIRDMLDTLISDGYLDQRNDGRYYFRMNLLREWWLRYVVL